MVNLMAVNKQSTKVQTNKTLPQTSNLVRSPMANLHLATQLLPRHTTPNAVPRSADRNLQIDKPR